MLLVTELGAPVALFDLVTTDCVLSAPKLLKILAYTTPLYKMLRVAPLAFWVPLPSLGIRLMVTMAPLPSRLALVMGRLIVCPPASELKTVLLVLAKMVPVPEPVQPRPPLDPVAGVTFAMVILPVPVPLKLKKLGLKISERW